MGEIVSIHSFRGGTGKSNLAANVGALLAKQGKRVGIVDTDIQSPGIHVLFGLTEETMTKSLNDFLWGKASIEEAAYHVGQHSGPERPHLRDLNLWLIPASIRTNEITRILKEGYDVNMLTEGFGGLIRKLKLDYLVIDTHPGLNEETLLSFALTSTLLVVLRPDQQDFQGTAVTVDIAKRLDVPRVLLVLNKVLAKMDVEALRRNAEETYDAPVAAVLPLSEDVVYNASNDLFTMRYPDHDWSRRVKALADIVMQPADAPLQSPAL
jgi:MinD-like ATPase involved in chromosome partitioning or flagellar assembly